MKARVLVLCAEHGRVRPYRNTVKKPNGKVYTYLICSRCSILNARAWQLTNRARLRANNRAYYWANRDRVLARNSKWSKANRAWLTLKWRERVFQKTGRVVRPRRAA